MKNNLTEEHITRLTALKNVLLLILTVIDLIFIILSTTYSISFRIERLIADYDLLVCILLFIDLCYEFYCSDRSIKEFLIDDRNIISLISVFPFDLLLRYFAVFRVFRFLKLIKVVRVWNVKRDWDSLYYFIQHHLFKLLLVVLIVYIIVSTTMFILIDSSVSNIGDALWFIAVTISTVGYGDIIPETPIGKALTMLSMVIGIIVSAIFTAYLSSIYNEKNEAETRETVKINRKMIEKNNKELHEEIKTVKEEFAVLKDENRQLMDKIDELNEKIDKLSEDD